MQNLRKTAQHVLKRALAQGVELIRVALFTLVYLASRFLPKTLALGLAGFAGLVMAASPIGAKARRTARALFPDADSSDQIAAEWLERPFRDYVTVARLAEGRESGDDLVVESRGAPAILNAPGESFILAFGHFSRHASAALYRKQTTDKTLVTVIAPLEQKTSFMRALRVRFQLGEMGRCMRKLRGDALEMIEVRGANVAMQALRRLKRPDKVLVMSVDAPWTEDRSAGFERPFAGYARQYFALGTAKLARLSQRPIVFCVPFLDSDNRIILQWHDPIYPTDSADAESDMRVTSQLLTSIEQAIGERPGQYAIAIGEDRVWDSAERRWKFPEEPAPTSRMRNPRARLRRRTSKADA